MHKTTHPEDKVR